MYFIRICLIPLYPCSHIIKTFFGGTPSAYIIAFFLWLKTQIFWFLVFESDKGICFVWCCLIWWLFVTLSYFYPFVFIFFARNLILICNSFLIRKK